MLCRCCVKEWRCCVKEEEWKRKSGSVNITANAKCKNKMKSGCLESLDVNASCESVGAVLFWVLVFDGRRVMAGVLVSW